MERILSEQARKHPTLFVHCARAVKLIDGCLWISRKGRMDDFEFYEPLPATGRQAISVTVGGGIREVRKRGAKLLMRCVDGRYYVLTGSDTRKMRIDWLPDSEWRQ